METKKNMLFVVTWVNLTHGEQKQPGIKEYTLCDNIIKDPKVAGFI